MKQIIFAVVDSVVSVQRPVQDRPIVDISLQPLVQSFCPWQIISLFTVRAAPLGVRAGHQLNLSPLKCEAVLLERQVLLHGSNFKRLTSCAEALRILLYPLRWAHVYVPLLPYMMEEATEAPTPYIMGLSCHGDDPAPKVMPGVVMADLDRGSLKVRQSCCRPQPMRCPIRARRAAFRSRGDQVGGSQSCRARKHKSFA